MQHRKLNVLSIVLFVCLFVMQMPFTVQAKDNDTIIYEAEPETEINMVTQGEYADSDTMFAGYVQKTFGNDAAVSLFSSNMMEARLSENNRVLYHYLKEKVSLIANGELDNAKIEVPVSLMLDQSSYSAQDLGVESIVKNGSITQEAKEALNEKIAFDSGKIGRALLKDCPYELYWFAKSTGWTNSISKSYSAVMEDGQYKLKFKDGQVVTFGFFVEPGFSLTGTEKTYALDTAKTSAAKLSASNAQKIVEDAKYLSDYEKLHYYANQICDLVSYNYDAAAQGTTKYGTISPWQLIYVFDENPDTNVVCEGYSKAFQYLCEMTNFNHDNIYCYMITGDMDGGGHMWNCVHMDDDKNYLVDVTNYDVFRKSENDRELFLDGGDELIEVLFDGEKTVGGYNIVIPRRDLGNGRYREAKTIEYLYDENALSDYYAEELTLAQRDFEEPIKQEIANKPQRVYGCAGTQITDALLADYPDWTWDKEEVVPEEIGESIVVNATYIGKDKGEYSGLCSEVTIVAKEHDFGSDQKAEKCAICARKNINAASIDELVKLDEIYYDGTSKKISVALNGVATSQYKIVCEQQKNAGSYEANLIGIGAYAGNRTIEWSIKKAKPKALHFSMQAPQDLVYDGMSKSVEVTQKNQQTVGNKLIDISGIGDFTVKYAKANAEQVELDEQAPSDAGDYDVYVDVVEGVNFEAGVFKIGSFSIEKASGEVSIDEDNKTLVKQFKDEDFALQGISKSGDGVLTFKSSDTNVVMVNEQGVVSIVGVGTAEITVGMNASNNYNAASEQSISITIEKADMPAMESVKKKYYYDIAHEDEIALDGMLPGDAGTVTYKMNMQDTTGDIVVQPAVAKNGKLSFMVNAGNVGDQAKIVIDVETTNYLNGQIVIDISLMEKRKVSIKAGEEVRLIQPQLTYGENLSQLQFEKTTFVDGDIVVEGTLTFSDAKMIPSVADTKAEWIFTPCEDVYDAVTGYVAIDVEKAIPTYEKPADLVVSCKDTLDTIELPEGFSWEDKSISLQAGQKNVLKIKYEPEDRENYQTVTGIELSILVQDHIAMQAQRENEKKATCTEDGSFEEVIGCSVCKQEIERKTVVVEALGHNWDAGKVTKAATSTQDGVKTYTCTRDINHTKKEIIPATGGATTTTQSNLEQPGKEEKTTETSEDVHSGTQEPTTEKVTTKDKNPSPKPLSEGKEIKDEVNHVTYKVIRSSGKDCEVSYEGSANQGAKAIVIPATVKKDAVTYKVTKIGDNAFKNQKTVTKITIPNNVTTIGKNAFYGCSKLKTITLGKNVTKVGNYAFKGCKNLRTITIKSTKLTTKSVSKKAFKGVTGVTTVKVPKSKLTTYKQLFKKKGLSSKVRVKKK